MTIRLKYYLNKSKHKLEIFCKEQNILTYADLKKYCLQRNIDCDVDEKEFNAMFPTESKKKNEPKPKPKPNPKPTPRRRGRKPKAKKTGTSNSEDNS